MTRLNRTRAATAGVEPFPIQLIAFTISAALTGWAGVLFADLNGFVSPAMFSWQRSGELMAIVLLAGRTCWPRRGAGRGT